MNDSGDQGIPKLSSGGLRTAKNGVQSNSLSAELRQSCQSRTLTGVTLSPSPDKVFDGELFYVSNPTSRDNDCFVHPSSHRDRDAHFCNMMGTLSLAISRIRFNNVAHLSA